MRVCSGSVQFKQDTVCCHLRAVIKILARSAPSDRSAENCLVNHHRSNHALLLLDRGPDAFACILHEAV